MGIFNEEKRAERSANREAERFANSAVGQARAAFARGDEVFQCSIDQMDMSAYVVTMGGAGTTKTVSDPSAMLNAVVSEGWDIVNGSFVFLEEGTVSRDKFLSSGQVTATRGSVVGYYVFRRAARLRALEDA